MSQLEAMASLPMDFHIKGLVETLKLGDRIDDVIETMIVLYVNGDTGTFWPLFKSVDAGRPGRRGRLCGLRADDDHRAQPGGWPSRQILSWPTGNAFIAVGALHLPGREGLIELFREAGYTVTAVN